MGKQPQSMLLGSLSLGLFVPFVIITDSGFDPP